MNSGRYSVSPYTSVDSEIIEYPVEISRGPLLKLCGRKVIEAVKNGVLLISKLPIAIVNETFFRIIIVPTNDGWTSLHACMHTAFKGKALKKHACKSGAGVKYVFVFVIGVFFPSLAFKMIEESKPLNNDHSQKNDLNASGSGLNHSQTHEESEFIDEKDPDLLTIDTSDNDDDALDALSKDKSLSVEAEGTPKGEPSKTSGKLKKPKHSHKLGSGFVNLMKSRREKIQLGSTPNVESSVENVNWAFTPENNSPNKPVPTVIPFDTKSLDESPAINGKVSPFKLLKSPLSKKNLKNSSKLATETSLDTLVERTPNEKKVVEPAVPTPDNKAVTKVLKSNIFGRKARRGELEAHLNTPMRPKNPANTPKPVQTKFPAGDSPGWSTPTELSPSDKKFSPSVVKKIQGGFRQYLGNS